MLRSQKLNTSAIISQNLESENRDTEFYAEEDEEVQSETQGMNADEGFIDRRRPSEVENQGPEQELWSGLIEGSVAKGRRRAD